jgi:undecaprenyl-diphosphatase
MDSFLLIIKAVVMGVVEGVTEFLPVSSTGHMIVIGSLIGFNDAFAKDLFEIVIQFGAILAVVVLYRKKIAHSFRTLRRGQFGFNLWLSVIMALIPSGIVAVLFYKKVKGVFYNPVTVAWAMIIGGIILMVMEYFFRNNSRTRRLEEVKPKQGFMVGVFQCLSFLWPGFSRSASTIMGGWAVGMTTAAAAEFTFFLAIPTMLGASLYSLHDAAKEGIVLDGTHIAALIIGFVVAFIVAAFVVKKFLEYLKRKPLKVFAIYRICAGVVILVLAMSVNGLLRV